METLLDRCANKLALMAAYDEDAYNLRIIQDENSSVYWKHKRWRAALVGSIALSVTADDYMFEALQLLSEIHNG